MRCRVLYLQSVLEELVHLSHLCRDGQIDGAVANLNDESTTDIGVDLGNDLELLALGNVLRLADGRLETAESAVVERRGAGDGELDLAPVCAHQLAELLDNTLQSTQPVVVCQCLEQVLHDAFLVLSEVLLELGNDLLLVRDGESGSGEDGGELGILLEDGGERLKGLGGGVEGVGLRSGRVLYVTKIVSRVLRAPLRAGRAGLVSLEGWERPIGHVRDVPERWRRCRRCQRAQRGAWCWSCSGQRPGRRRGLRRRGRQLGCEEPRCARRW